MEFLLLCGIMLAFALVATIWIKYDASKPAKHKL